VRDVRHEKQRAQMCTSTARSSDLVPLTRTPRPASDRRHDSNPDKSTGVT
jgi:hypothetical protein